MSKQSPIGRVKCPYCNKEVAVTPTENYWFHIPEGRGPATKGQFRTYCTGSGEPLRFRHLQEIRT